VPEFDHYLSLDPGPETELKEKGSRFPGQAFAVEGEVESADALRSVQKKHHAATHHCWAHRLGRPDAVTERSDDNGEPSGTAGLPILQAIQRADVYGALVVVTRYYGGTKLGTGGLVRAYGDSATLALDAAPRRDVWLEAEILIRTTYPDVGIVEATLAQQGAIVRRCARDFGDAPVFRVATLVSRAEGLRQTLIEATAGRAEIDLRF
jgi:uncharacterized YigZ family protein